MDLLGAGGGVVRILGQFLINGGETAELGFGAGTLGLAEVLGGEIVGLDRPLVEVLRPEEWLVFIAF